MKFYRKLGVLFSKLSNEIIIFSQIIYAPWHSYINDVTITSQFSLSFAFTAVCFNEDIILDILM